MVWDLWGIARRQRSVTPGDKAFLLRLAKGKCENCGFNIIGEGMQPDIHHIVPFSSRGSDGFHNLIVLCPNCHRKVEQLTKEHLRSKIAYRVKKPGATTAPTKKKASVRIKALKPKIATNKVAETKASRKKSVRTPKSSKPVRRAKAKTKPKK
jgi:5-methylcytosine-specific restriction endonuclease McrA